jgi:hypothetical protein
MAGAVWVGDVIARLFFTGRLRILSLTSDTAIWTLTRRDAYERHQ